MRLLYTKEDRHVCREMALNNFERHEDESLGAVWGTRSAARTIRGVSCIIFEVKGFSGSKGKPDFWYTFRAPEAMATYINTWLDGLRGRTERKNADRIAATEAKAAGHSVAVGDLYHTSWGYDQTNVDWFKVIAVTKAGATVVPLCSREEETCFMSGWSTPVDETCGEPFKVRFIVGKPGEKWSCHIHGHWAGYESRGFAGRASCSWYA